MIRLQVKIIGAEPPSQDLLALGGRLRELGPLRLAFGERLKRSVEKNFAAGGRPTPWLPSRKKSGKTLIDTGRLKNSVTYRVDGQDLALGTNVRYGAAHQLGVDQDVTVPARLKRHIDGRLLRTGQTKRHMRLPARPFLMVQDEDWVYLGRLLKTHLMGGAGHDA